MLGWACSMLWGADPRDIVRRTVEANERSTDASLHYTFLERQEVRELDASGKVKSRKIETWDVTPLEGSPYRKLVARNDQPLMPAEQQQEEEKLRFSNQQRRQETPEQRDSRVAAWKQRQERQRAPLRELPDAFNFTLAGEEQMGGRTVYVIEGRPRPGYHPKSRFSSFFPKVRLRMWIDQQDYQGAKVEMEAMDTITFGGFLVRLAKGTRLLIEQTRVNEEAWMPRHIFVTASARILLVKGFRRDFEYTFSDYKKFTVDSRVAAAGGQP